MSTEVIDAPTTTPALEDGSHDRFTHLVLEGYTPRGDDGELEEFVPLDNCVVDGMINGTPVRALCGKVWVPGEDPTRYPLCPGCKEIAEQHGWTLPA